MQIDEENPEPRIIVILPASNDSAEKYINYGDFISGYKIKEEN